MPLALVGRIKYAVVSVPVSTNWQAGVERFLLAVSGDPGRIERHLAILEDRLQGRLPWAEILAGATLSDGQPMPASRRYAEMLVAEDRLPLYDVGPLRVSLGLHNPGNEVGVPEYDADQLELAIVADAGYFALAPRPVFPAQLGFEELAQRRAADGRSSASSSRAYSRQRRRPSPARTSERQAGSFPRRSARRPPYLRRPQVCVYKTSSGRSRSGAVTFWLGGWGSGWTNSRSPTRCSRASTCSTGCTTGSSVADSRLAPSSSNTGSSSVPN